MMPAARRLARRLRNALLPDRADAELSRELEAHLVMLEERFRLSGMSARDAAAAARRQLGIDRTRELHRDARSIVWLEDLRHDVRFAARILARTPGFTFLAVLTLALGIGSVTVIYSVIHNVLLDPLPYPHAERLVNVSIRTPAGGGRFVFTADEFEAYRDRSSAFDAVIGTRGLDGLLVTPERSEAVRAVRVTANFFDVMGLPPLLGRTLAAGDARSDAPSVAVLRHRAWINFFGADPGIVGRVLILDGEPRTVVGVMPPRFTWHGADLWIPVRESDGPASMLNFQARLRPGTNLEQAAAQLNTIAAGRAREYPDEYPEDFTVRVTNVIQDVVGSFKGVLFSLLAAVGLLMLIACCNVANMLLARATTREREMTVRAALGAGRGRLIRQLLVESALLAGTGAAGGVLLAYGGLRALVPLLPEGPLPGEIEIALNRPVLLIALGTAVVSGLLFGLVPALFSARADLMDGLKSGGRGQGDRRAGLRSVLVVAEIALAVVLVLSSGLLLRTFLAIAGQDLGFDPRHVMSLRPAFPPGAYADAAERRRFYLRLIERIASVPGVEHAAAVSGIPPFGGFRAAVDVPGRKDSEATAFVQRCTDDFFATLGVPIIRGRGLAEDRFEEPRAVAVVNQAFVKAFLEGVEPIGRTIRVAAPESAPVEAMPTTYEIVGVAGDMRNRGVREPAMPEIYVAGIAERNTPVVLVRAAIGQTGVARAIRHEVAQLDRQVALRETTLSELLDRYVYAQPRFSLMVLAAFSITGMLLVAIGIYSVMAYTVSQQTRDIAVRLALGARRSTICAMVLRWAVTLLIVGLGLGLTATFATNRWLAAQLWQISPYDVSSILATVALVAAIAVAACLVPMRRAMDVEPMAALRQE